MSFIKNWGFLYIFPLVGLGLAIYNSWMPYSYWADEIGSVSMSTLPIAGVLSAIGLDVHPPLFQLLMKGWVAVFGSDEPHVRLLSLLCCLCAAAYLFYQTRKINNISRWSTITIFSTCFLFPFYAQEARSYGLTLFLSTLLTVQYINYDINNSIRSVIYLIFTALVLSLCHYFGLLLSLSVLFLLIVEHRKNIKVSVMLFCGFIFCLIWPAIHYLIGLAGLKSTKNAWMVIDGPVDTARIFLRTFFPNLSDNYLLLIALFLMSVIAYSAFINRKSALAEIPASNCLNKLIALLCLMLFGIVSVDTFSAISTERNFIVLLPSVSLIIGFAAERLLYKHKKITTYTTVLVIALWATNSLYFSYHLLKLKWEPQQNWRGTAQFVIDNYKLGKLYYLRNRDDEEVDRVFNFYIKKLSAETIALERIYIEQIPDIKAPSMLVLGGASPSTFELVKKRIPSSNLQIFQPKQSLGGTTGVMIFE